MIKKEENSDGLPNNNISGVQTDERESVIKLKNEKKQTKKKRNSFAWPIKILIFTIVLSLSFSLFSEFVLTKTGIIVALYVLIPLLLLAVISDMVGVAVAACGMEPFTAMASRKVRGAKESIFLVKNAEKVSSICNDVIGDVCGIISGAIGVTIVAKIMTLATFTTTEKLLITSSVSALIAGVTVFGKAIGKKVAIGKSTYIVHKVGKFLSLFTRKIK